MSFDDFSSQDLLATITSAFDLASSSSSLEEKSLEGNLRNQSSSNDSMPRDDRGEKMEKEDLPSFGQVYSSTNPSYLCYPQTQNTNNFYHPSDGKYHQMTHLSTETGYSGQEVDLQECFSGNSTGVSLSNENDYWNETTANPFPQAFNTNSGITSSKNSCLSRRRTSSASTTKSSKRIENKQMEQLKLRYNRTLSFLKEANLYDVTMKAADLIRRNTLIQLEIDQLRNDISSYFASGFA